MSGRARRLSLGWWIVIAVVILIAVAMFLTQTLEPKP
jgi:hypothetical protein